MGESESQTHSVVLVHLHCSKQGYSIKGCNNQWVTFHHHFGPYHCFYRVSAIFYMPRESQTKISLSGSCPLKRSIVIYAYIWLWIPFLLHRSDTFHAHSSPSPLRLSDLFHILGLFLFHNSP